MFNYAEEVEKFISDKLKNGDKQKLKDHLEEDEELEVQSQTSSINIEELDPDFKFVQEKLKQNELLAKHFNSQSKSKNKNGFKLPKSENRGHSIIKIYRYTDLLKKYEEEKDLTAQEKYEKKLNQKH